MSPAVGTRPFLKGCDEIIQATQEMRDVTYVWEDGIGVVKFSMLKSQKVFRNKRFFEKTLPANSEFYVFGILKPFCFVKTICSHFKQDIGVSKVHRFSALICGFMGFPAGIQVTDRLSYLF